MEFIEVDGWHINPNEKVKTAIVKRLDLIEQMVGEPYCPCQYSKDIPNEKLKDIICPCVAFRAGEGCHCHLYLKD